MVSTDLSTVEYDGHAIVELCGELDVTDAAGVAAVLAGILADRPNIIIDLAALEFIDCGGLRALAGAREQARRAGGDLLLAAPQRLVLRVLALTGLADVASVRASVEQAGPCALETVSLAVAQHITRQVPYGAAGVSSAP